jgi:hypothetical protein
MIADGARFGISDSDLRTERRRAAIGIATLARRVLCCGCVALPFLSIRGRSSVVEQGPFKPRVVGSSPTGLTNPGFVAREQHGFSWSLRCC